MENIEDLKIEDIDSLTHSKLLYLGENFFKELAFRFHIDFVDLDKENNFEQYLYVLPLVLMEKYELFCYKEDEENLYIVSYKPLKSDGLIKIQNIFRTKNICLSIAEFSKFEYFFRRMIFLIKFKNYSQELEKILISQDTQDGDYLKQILLLILSYANFLKASDIHFEPLEEGVKLRFRIDGILQNIIIFKSDIYQSLLTYIKMISLLNVAEQKNSQDGSFTMEIEDEKFDFRVSIMPLLFGQSVVIRILKQENALELANLFLEREMLHKVQLSAQALSGLILFCGPTGSGKSTFMHAMLSELDESKKIITLEDPIEYKLKNAQQILLNTKANFDFHKALRGVLRQDPDVIMVGEIRDEESLDIVLKASLSGHLVLSTLHTNSALEAVFRMMHMGAKSYLIARSLNLVISQRLVRRLCECKEEQEESFIYKNQTIKGKFYKARGCSKCMMSGYKGRIMVAEFLFIDKNIKNMIENNYSFEDIQKYALMHNFITLSEDALNKAKIGLTSVDEIWKIVL
ncbi:GspE/PulE family protein [Campylobacter insulaenigrae]|uniref:Type II/IV secretion system protein n=1 Tax=Campylobacter insulaenigrae TaxID=260714 RepID=A0ABY3G4D3_9BACT|nr:GspE/PulE family protein [Campylobacter insulaenigrae]MCR6578124.1 GspE/PulE family protein [Campylobacter insulaenigrae]MCR6584363.1 GspE/PulE family protein [Campylobacter insulaenigrae]TWO26107.1 type II/IV secretion system protein [Campylobacter insulaenigrae]